MPELATPVRYGVNPPVFNPAATPIRPLEVDQTKSAKAALFSTIANAISELPAKLIASYEQGRKLKTGNTVRNQYDQVLRGQRPASGAVLSDFTATGEGAVSLSAEDPTLRSAKATYYQNARAPKTGTELYDFLGTQFRSGTPSAPTGTAVGKITDYGQMDDPHFDTNSAIKKIGAWDNPLEEGVSLAVSPDIRAQFEAAGIKPRDMVNIKTADGKVMTVRWDDVTANDEQAKRLGLPPLRGRYDIFSPSGPHPLRDAEIIGFEPAGVAPDRQAAIGAAATQVGGELANIDPSALTAANTPGPIAAAPVAPAGALADVPVRRATIGRDPSTGAMLYSPSPNEMTAIFPSGDKIDVSPKVAAAGKEAEGRIFATAKDAADAGFDPTDATVLPDGRIQVTKYKPSGTDVRGRSKLVASQQKQIESASKLAQTIDSALEEYDNLHKQGKAGIVGGRIEKLKGSIGLASEDSAKAQAKLNRMLYGIARELNGAGVLTNQDLGRAEASAPSITEGRDQFKGKLEAIKEDLRIGIKNSLAANAGKLSAEQIAMGEEALKSLEGGVGTAPAPQSSPSAPATGMVRMVKPDGTAIRVPADKVEEAKKLGATIP